jgi:heme-degrading monooxygenase HmoA
MDRRLGPLDRRRMTETMEVRPFAPTPDTIAYSQQVLPSRRMTPGVVGGLDGPGGPLGPELAGALTLAYGAFADDAGAQRGYRHFADIQHAMLGAPGFIRWFSFADGPHGYGLGLWRTAEDAVAFVRGPQHRTAVAAQHRAPFEYSQFAGIWTAHTLGRRTMHCPECGGRAVAPAQGCGGCGRRLDDGFIGAPA